MYRSSTAALPWFTKTIVGLTFLSNAVLVQSASLTLEFYDEQQQVVPRVVVALIPQNKLDYSSQPTAIMDQRNNAFVPDVLAIRVNTMVQFPNGDNVRHHVYSFSPAKRFELRLYHGQTAEPVLFDKPGQVVLGCNIHDSMLGYIYVLETDHYGISNDQGLLVIDDIPAGEYQLQIQHPQLEEQSVASKSLSFVAGDALSQRIQLTGLISPKAAENTDGELKKLFKRTD